MENVEPATHQCDRCNDTFKNKGALATHQRYCNRKATPPVPYSFLLGPEPAPEPGDTPRFETLPEVPQVLIRKLEHYGSLPNIARATEGSAGYDLYAAIEERRCIGVGEWMPVPTGISLELPPNMVAKVVPRSGLALRDGMSLMNTPGIIDSDYRGEIIAIMVNHATRKFWVEPGMRIAQMLFEYIVIPDITFVDRLTVTKRGEGGFGSTGA